MNTTPTPYFQKLTQTKSPRQIAFIFLDHLAQINWISALTKLFSCQKAQKIISNLLKKNYPIPEDIKVSVKFTSKARNHGATNGYIVMDRAERTVKITIYEVKTTETPELLSTLPGVRVG